MILILLDHDQLTGTDAKATGAIDRMVRVVVFINAGESCHATLFGIGTTPTQWAKHFLMVHIAQALKPFDGYVNVFLLTSFRDSDRMSTWQKLPACAGHAYRPCPEASNSR